MTDSTLTPPPPSTQPAGFDPGDFAAWDYLPADAREELSCLTGFMGALRAVADHPALPLKTKEAVLGAMAHVLRSPEGLREDGDDAAVSAARALGRHLLLRGIESQGTWQMVQAALQDVRKSRYADWSDLLTWCRFSAAPAAGLGCALAGIKYADRRRIESLAIAVALLILIERARGHARWLDRVYLPERWFAEAGCDASALAAERAPAALSKIRARALDQVEALLNEAWSLPMAITDRKGRRMAAVALAEARAWARALRRGEPFTGPVRPSKGARFRARVLGLWRAVLHR